MAVIMILALLTISGAVISDQILTRDERAAQTTNWNCLKISWKSLENLLEIAWGTTIMLSVDQVLRLISVPAVVAAFLIASQVSGAGVFHSAPAQLASEWRLDRRPSSGRLAQVL
jgi:hypothetical protein